MARNKPVIRFAVEAGGRDYELFKLWEGPHGDVMLSKHPLFFEREIGDIHEAPMTDQRYSVHVSPKSPTGHLLKATYTLKAGKPMTNAVFVDCRDRPLLALLFSRRFPAPADERLLEAGPDDQIIRLPAYDPTTTNLACHVLVSKAGSLIDFGPLSDWPVTTAKFRHFDLHVLHYFIPLPSIEQGDTMMWKTSDNSFLSGPALAANYEPAPSHTAQQMGLSLLSYQEGLALRLVDRCLHAFATSVNFGAGVFGLRAQLLLERARTVLFVAP